VADDVRARVAFLRGRAEELRIQLADVEARYDAGMLTLAEEVDLLTGMMREMRAVVHEMSTIKDTASARHRRRF
jgi:hypothetical protein